MGTLVDDIKSTDWQLSTAGVGVIAEGVQDVRQCLDIILRTVKGTDPLRPDFGSDIYLHVDKPVNVAIPNMVKAIIEAITIWEARVQLQKVEHETIESNTSFLITYKLVDDELVDRLTLMVKGGFISIQAAQVGSLILEAFFPDSYQTKSLTIEFIIDGSPALPSVYENGFANISDLFNWVQTNWAAYGRWFLASDRIVLYANPDIGSSGSLQITTIETKRYISGIPALSFGETYSVMFTPDTGIELSHTGFVTMEDMLLYARLTWGVYGVWEIEPDGSIVAGEFTPDEFTPDEFITGESGYALVLYSKTEKIATLSVLKA